MVATMRFLDGNGTSRTSCRMLFEPLLQSPFLLKRRHETLEIRRSIPLFKCPFLRFVCLHVLRNDCVRLRERARVPRTVPSFPTEDAVGELTGWTDSEFVLVEFWGCRLTRFSRAKRDTRVCDGDTSCVSPKCSWSAARGSDVQGEIVTGKKEE